MNEARLLQVLRKPRMSEKAVYVGEKNRQYVFEVQPDATKQEIKQAVKLIFEVEVNSVQVVNVKGKRKAFGRVRGKRSDWKKAYVGLKDGHEITFAA
jgi:large subunit ribosomal protein L23